MHWLPLVAMVIASALPFPYSPVTRIVAATTETSSGSHDDGSGGGGADGSLPPPPLAVPPTHNRSDGTDPHLPTANPRPEAGRRTPRGSETLPERGPPGELRTGAGGRDGERADGSSYRDGPGVLSQGGPRCADADAPVDAAVTRDYQPGATAAAARDSQRKENLHTSRDGGTAGNHDGPSPVPESGLESPATGPQRGAGPQGPGEETPVATETGAGVPLGEGEGRSPGTKVRPGPAPDGVQEVDELFLDAHPRVLFSPSASPPRHPPLLLMLESGALPEGEGDAGYDPLDGEGASPSWAAAAAGGGARRTKRSDLSDLRRGERSVCESESLWVTNKKTAVDNHGRTVTILPVIQTPTGPLRQYFYETRCRRGDQQRGPASASAPARGSSPRAAGAGAGLGLGVAGSGCLGVDKKQWKSECKAKHSFVRALAKDASNRMGWRWIRIDSSCVCVLLARVSRQAGGKV
ncbi:collagen alpha-1(III) chain [Gadus morhua]|uniref:Neurotrophin-4 n=1 Tax=Gadus morhua TaxID=8049 RepID=A0A8C5CIQ0_GADMO|nr:collagen alpha-1(III) chain-like [Gadus morhua]